MICYLAGVVEAGGGEMGKGEGDGKGWDTGVQQWAARIAPLLVLSQPALPENRPEHRHLPLPGGR